MRIAFNPYKNLIETIGYKVMNSRYGSVDPVLKIIQGKSFFFKYLEVFY